MAKIFVYRKGGITTAGIEGEAKALEQGIKKYQKGRPKFYVDFGPIFRDSDEKLFLAANVYFPEVATMVFYQYLDKRSPNTSISCHGTSDDAIELIKEFGRTLEFKTIDPTDSFKSELRMAHGPIEATWKSVESVGRTNQKIVLASALGMQLQKYRAEKARTN